MCNRHFRAMAFVICLSISRPAPADCADADVEAAFHRQDIPALRHIIDDDLAQPALGPIAAAVLGLAAYRAAILLKKNSQGSDAQSLIAQVADGIDPIRAKTRDADVTALMSMLYGLEIALSPVRG